MRRLEAGSLVEHRTLGTGKVVAVEPNAIHVFFPGSGTRFAAKLRWPAAEGHFLAEAPAADTALQGLDSFTLDAATGRYALAANFIGPEEAVAAFLADHPGGFEPPEAPRSSSRVDRRDRWRTASATWAATLGGEQGAALLDDDEAELVERLLVVFRHAAPVPGMVEIETVAEALQPGGESREFLAALLSYLSVPSPARARFDRLCAAVHALGAPPEAAWPLVTFFPFVAVPSRQVLLLPRSACAGASRLGWDLRFQATPNWSTYGRWRELSARMLERLAPHGARDHMDVEGFLHSTGAQRPAAAATKGTRTKQRRPR